MRAIVTGGAGFIGSHVVDALLARGDEVLVLDDLSNGKRENVPDGARLEVADMREPLGAHFEGAEACFHLAAQVDVRVSVERPAYDAATNVLGTIQVLEAARAHGTRVVFASTGGAIYGECDGPAPEESERRPVAPYGDVEAGGRGVPGRLEPALRHRGTSRSATGTSTGRGRTRTARPASSRSSSAGSRPARPPRIFGDGSATRDYVYVGDVARASLAAAGAGRRRLQRRHRDRDLRDRAVRALPPRRRARSSRRSTRRRGSASCSAASSTARAQNASSAGGPRSASRTGCALTWESLQE